MIWPSNITAIRSESDMISSSSTETSKIALPASRRLTICWWMNSMAPIIDAARRLADQKNIRVALDLAGHDNLLLIAAGKAFGLRPGVGRAHVEFDHLGLRVGPNGRVVHQDRVFLIGRVVVIAKDRVFPCEKLHDQAFALPVFGHMGNAVRAPRLAVGFAAAQVDRHRPDLDRTLCRAHAAQNLQKLGLAVARHPGDAQNFTGADVQADAF